MATPTAEALEKARLVFAGGPFLPRNNPVERVELLGKAYGLAFPNEDALNLGCSGCVARGYSKLEYWFNKYSPTAAGPDAEQTQPTPLVMAANNRRYSFRDPNATYRPFGAPETYTNKNLTDEVVARIVKESPASIAMFVDNETGEGATSIVVQPAGGSTATYGTATGAAGYTGQATDELTQTNQKILGLRQVLAIQTGAAPSAYQHTDAATAKLELEALQNKLGVPAEAPAPAPAMQASQGGQAPQASDPNANPASQVTGGQAGLGDPNAKAPQVGNLTDAGQGNSDAPSTSLPTTGQGMATLPELSGTTAQTYTEGQANGTAPVAQVLPAGVTAAPPITKQPMPSELRQMNKQQLVAQYTTELGAAPDLNQLSTNQALVDAIVAFREHSAQ